MRKTNKWKIVISCVAAMTMTLALPLSASAMPADVNGDGDGLYGDGFGYDSDTSGQNTMNSDYYEIETVDANYVATQAANVRSTPNGTIIGNLVTGEKYYVVGKVAGLNWYKVSGFISGDAYVYGDYLVPEKEYTAPAKKAAVTDVEKLNIKMTTTANVNMRDEPNGNVVGTLEEGTEVLVTGNVNDESWYRCKIDGDTVYIYDDYLAPELPQTMAATNNVNVRNKPTTAGDIIGSLAIGDKVKVSAMEDGWYRFKFEKTGTVGYAFANYLAAVK